MKTEKVAFGGGCFWCTEAVFSMLKGVLSVVPGYAGGETKNPTYEQVSGGHTGHIEVVFIEYDPEKVPFEKLLTVFFATHDPTTPNRQGNDIGTQYRSAILYSTPEQKEKAEKFIQELNDSTREGKLVITEVKPLGEFYKAEEYHLNYYKNNRTQGYCELIIAPKVQKVQQKFAELLKEEEGEK